MTVRRDLTISGKTPLAHVPDIDATINYHSGLLLGQLTSVAGTADAITGNLREASGFTNGTLKAGAIVALVAGSNCIGPSTLAISGQSALAIKSRAGADLAADAWASGDMLLLVYQGDATAHWRLMVAAAATSSGAASGDPTIPYIFTSSGTLTFPEETNVKAFIWGGGGAGAAQTAGSAQGATGGAGGGLAIKSALLEAATVLSVTVGAATASTTGPNNGASGNDSSVSGGNFGTVTAPGGAGGTYGALPVSGAAGGIPTTGDINFVGGASGDTAGTQRFASGGGGAPWLRDGYASGDADSSNPANVSKGTGGASLAAATADNTTAGGVAPTFATIMFGLIDASGYTGGNGIQNVSGAAGAGSPFCGGGGHGINGGTCVAGAGGLAAGGGGAVNAGAATGGAGGAGLVIIFTDREAVQA